MANDGEPSSNNIPCAISLGKISGIPIRLHYTFFLLLVLSIVSGLMYNSVKYFIFVAILYGPILLITIIVVRKMRSQVLVQYMLMHYQVWPVVSRIVFFLSFLARTRSCSHDEKAW
jgi:hypothetical protein